MTQNLSTLGDAVIDRLKCSSNNICGQWQRKRPETGSRYAVCDDFLPLDVASALSSQFDEQRDKFKTVDSFRERKSTARNLPSLHLKSVFDALQDRRVVSLIGDLTGIDALQPDASHLRGGLSIMERGDFLNPHIDNSHGPDPSQYRRLNLLYYVTPGWRAEDGGSLELWDSRVRTPARIPALFNRLVIMNTDRRSWHSVDPVRAAAPRRCISTYYFSPMSPDGTSYYHVTSFTGRPGQAFLRAISPIDNAARQIAKNMLHMTRVADRAAIADHATSAVSSDARNHPVPS